MKLLVIYNPYAWGGRAGRMLRDVREEFARHRLDAKFRLTRAPGQATGLVAGTSLGEYDGVVAAGGDGTVHEVVNGLFRHAPDNRVPLGVLPLGTGNAFARDFGLGPGNWSRSIARIARGERRPCDAGRVKTADDLFYFVNIIGMGFAVDAGMTAKRLKWVGKPAYTLGTLWQILKLHSYPLVMHLDGERLVQDNIFVEVSNSRYTGTKFLIAPGAKTDDGLLDVTLLRGLGRLRLLRLFPTVYTGRHVAFDEVEIHRAGAIRIESPQGMLMTVDGEFRGRTPLEIECLPAAIELLV